MEVLIQFYAAGSPKVAELPSATGEQLLGRVIEQVPKLVKSLADKGAARTRTTWRSRPDVTATTRMPRRRLAGFAINCEN